MSCTPEAHSKATNGLQHKALISIFLSLYPHLYLECCLYMDSAHHHMPFIPLKAIFFLFPLTHHVFHKPPPQLHHVLMSQRCCSSPSFVSSSWVSNASTSWGNAGEFFLSWIENFLLHAWHTQSCKILTQQRITDWMVSLIYSGRAVMEEVILAFFCH